MTVYTVVDWKKIFEKADTRKVKDPKWVAVPNRHDGAGYRTIVARPDGLEVFGVWVLIIQVISRITGNSSDDLRKSPDGLLKVPDGLCAAEYVALKTGANRQSVENALSVLSSREIGWLKAEEIGAVKQPDPEEILIPPETSGESPGVPGNLPTTGQDKTGQDKTSERYSAEVQQQPEPEQPPPARFPDSNPPPTPMPRAVRGKPANPSPWLDPIRQALAEVTGKPSAPGDTLPEDLAHDAAALGVHPALVARWIFRTGKARGEPIRSHGFFSSLVGELPAWLATQQMEPEYRVGQTVACRCGEGVLVQFADCIVGHRCPSPSTKGLRHA